MAELGTAKGRSIFSCTYSDDYSHDVSEKYFDLLKDTLQKHLLFDKPSQVYNCDESGMPLEHKMPRTIAEKGVKKVRNAHLETRRKCQFWHVLTLLDK